MNFESLFYLFIFLTLFTIKNINCDKLYKFDLNYIADFTLLNDNIIIFSSNGFFTFDSNFNSLYNYTFSSELNLYEEKTIDYPSFTQFSEEEGGYVMCYILKNVYIFNYNGEFQNLTDANETSVVKDFINNYKINAYKKENSELYYSVISSDNKEYYGEMRMFYYKINLLNYNKNLLFYNTHGNYNENHGNYFTICCEKMTTNNSDNYITCFYQFNKDISLVIGEISFKPDKNFTFIEPRKYLTLNNSVNVFQYSSSVTNEDKSKVYICFSADSTNASCFYYDINTREFSGIHYFGYKCKRGFYVNNLSYFRKTKEFIFSCVDSVSLYSIIKFDENINLLQSNSYGIYNLSAYCYSVNSFFILYSFEQEEYILFSSAKCEQNLNNIYSYSLASFYNTTNIGVLNTDLISEHENTIKTAIIKSTGISSFIKITKSTEIIFSTKITESTQISPSIKIIESTKISPSNKVTDSNMISSSTKITESTGITLSIKVTESTIISSSTKITESTMISPSTIIAESTIIYPSTKIAESTKISPSTKISESTMISPSTKITESTKISPSTKITESTMISPSTKITESTQIIISKTSLLTEVNKVKETILSNKINNTEIISSSQYNHLNEKSIVVKNSIIGGCNDYKKIINENNECICDNINGYYSLNINNKIDGNCYNEKTKPKSFYLNKQRKQYEMCHRNCLTCNYNGNENENNCTSCVNGYIFTPDINSTVNCVQKCQYLYYFNSYGVYGCTNTYQCPIETHLLIRNKNKCIDNCYKDNIYKYQYSGECFEKCPEETNTNGFKCEVKNINSCSISNFQLNITIDEIIENNIDSLTKNYVDEFNYTNKHVINYKNKDYSLVLYKNSSCIKELSLTVPQIDFGECYSKFKIEYNKRRHHQ